MKISLFYASKVIILNKMITGNAATKNYKIKLVIRFRFTIKALLQAKDPQFCATSAPLKCIHSVEIRLRIQSVYIV